MQFGFIFVMKDYYLNIMQPLDLIIYSHTRTESRLSNVVSH